MRDKAPFRLLYNNDTTNTVGVVSPWHRRGEPFSERLLVASIDEVAGTGVDAYLLSPGMGWVPWWQSSVEPDFYSWWQDRTGLDVRGWNDNGYDTYVQRGGDMVRVLIDTCRRHGMAPFVSLRLNDVHHQEHHGQATQRSLVSCRFYTEHPEWHIDPSHPEREGYYKRRGMDWAVPEVRRYKLALLRELAENYDLAGLELDFLRDDVLFRDDGPSERERVELITSFVAEVRKALDRRSGAHRWLCVRIPLQLSAHAHTGLDVERLHEAGVDMFNLSGWYHTTQRTDVQEVRRRLPEAAIYLEMTHSTGNHPYFLTPGNYGTSGDVRTSDHQFYTTAELAHRRGADGLSLFNFVYYRSGHDQDVPVTEPPFHVLPVLNNPDELARQDKVFTIARTVYHRQIPAELPVGQPTEFTLDMIVPDHPGGDGRLRLHTVDPLTEDHRIEVHLGDSLLAPCEDVSRFFGNPYDPMIGPRSNRRAWVLPQQQIVDGLNTLTVRLVEGTPLTLVYIDAGLPTDD